MGKCNVPMKHAVTEHGCQKVEFNIEGTREIPFFRLKVVSVEWISWLCKFLSMS